MATSAPRSTPTAVPRREPEPTGWVVFAAVVLLVSGTFGTIWGLAAILNDEVITVGGRGVIIADFTTWGWVHLVVGAIMIATSFGLFAMSDWARWTAILFAMLNAILQVGAFPVFPLWSLVAIALDVIVIYQLTVRWETAR
jgi:hypothetical protein